MEFSSYLNKTKQRIFNRQSLVNYANTPYDVIYDDGLTKLRHYSASKNQPTHKTPIFFVTPLAVSTAIYDLLENRSLVRFLTEQGFSIYIVDWGKPDRKHSKLGFNYYVAEALPHLVKAIKDYEQVSQISMHGWSMGGMFAYLYTAFSKDDSIKNLVLLGTPVDAHASGYVGKLSNMADKVYEKAEQLIKLHPRQLPHFVLHSYGWANVLAFKAVDPIGTVKTYLKMFRNMHDEQKMKENATKSDFLLRMYDYPGRVVRDIAIGFWLENKVIKGTFKIKNELIDLSHITANLLVISGANDALVTTECATPILDIVASTDTTHLEIPGGHVSIVCSKKTCNDAWPMMADWLAKRSD